ncbi:hypothetical protein M5361_13650 [Ligilactobacillus agilis]|nr:hypothetical protein [Ligilactobacillus agilis]
MENANVQSDVIVQDSIVKDTSSSENQSKAEETSSQNDTAKENSQNSSSNSSSEGQSLSTITDTMASEKQNVQATQSLPQTGVQSQLAIGAITSTSSILLILIASHIMTKSIKGLF